MKNPHTSRFHKDRFELDALFQEELKDRVAKATKQVLSHHALLIHSQIADMLIHAGCVEDYKDVFLDDIWLLNYIKNGKKPIIDSILKTKSQIAKLL